MQRNLDIPPVFQRQIFTLMLSILAATSLATGQTSHAVTINFTTSPASYSDNSSTNGVPSTPNPKAYRLPVDVGDTVVWKATTHGAKNAVAVFFPNGTPFADQNGRPVSMIVWSERDVNSPPVTVVEDSGTYEYQVAAYDEDNKVPYTDDPKIIVGSGNLESDVAIAMAAVKRAGASSPNDSEKKLIESIEEKLVQLRNEVKHPK
jgi:plastocyanin